MLIECFSPNMHSVLSREGLACRMFVCDDLRRLEGVFLRDVLSRSPESLQDA